jgi:hypothetical protein
LEKAVPLNFFGTNTVISCDAPEARNLLLYASHCPGVIASIHKALRSAGLPVEYRQKASDKRLTGDFGRTTDVQHMSESKSAPDALEVLRKTMDEIARQIGAMDPDDRRRKILVNELSELTRLRIWLRSETNKVFVEKANELMRELARIKIGDRHRIEVLAKILRLMPSLKEQ